MRSGAVREPLEVEVAESYEAMSRQAFIERVLEESRSRTH